MTIIDPQLQHLLHNRPSIIRNSFVVWLVRISFGIMAPMLSLMGFACVIGGDLQKSLFLNPMVQANLIDSIVAEQLHNNTWLLGVILLISGTLSFLVIWLCKKLLERNWFMMELEVWKYEWENNEAEKNQIDRTR